MKISMKKLTKVALATALLTSAAATTAAANGAEFSDVPKTNVHYENIYNLTDRSILKGYPDGTYQPEQQLTRAEAAVILANALKLDSLDAPRAFFSDVKRGSWYFEEVSLLAKHDLITGYENGKFGPNDKLTRAQMATILANAYDLFSASDLELPFTDVVEGSWYDEYVQGMYRFDVTAGTTPTKFAPNDFVRRDEMASFVVNSEKVSEEEKMEEWMAYNVEYFNALEGNDLTVVANTETNIINVTIAPTDRNFENSTVYDFFYLFLPMEEKVEGMYIKGNDLNFADPNTEEFFYFEMLDMMNLDFVSDINGLHGKYITLVFEGMYGEKFEYTITFRNE
ncbi:S-layer homology domain-containing protein [Chryseomicrobium sp. FSL W7-1435]|uniref:S-layer homology domain-containing protein n=1 Tax=Chryseomicrobium sp. FSL W7-1435 TaxID=2921704 RepID=UPI00315A8274